MPIYEYHCELCDRKFEVRQKFSDTPLTEHEGCGGVVERLISTSALKFKGTGWYVTDYAPKNGSGGDKTEAGGGSAAKSEPAKGESKSESKNDSKSGSKSEPAAAPASTSSTTSTTKSDSK